MNTSARVLGASFALGTLALGCTTQEHINDALTNIAAVASDADTLVLKLQDSVAAVTSKVTASNNEIADHRFVIIMIIIVIFIFLNVHLHFRHWKIDSVEV